MKFYLAFFIAIIFISQSLAQTVTCTRTADLIRSKNYDVTGDAILELFDDNSVKLRLTSDFMTSRGPDVQIFLSPDSMDISNAVALVDIGTSDGIAHFSGALNIDLPNDLTVDQYDHIVFRCFAFQVHWAHGNFDARCADGGTDTTNNMMNMDTTACLESIAATVNWGTQDTVCATDGTADIIPLANTQLIPAGDHYAYVFTDKELNIRFLHYEDEFDFEGSGQQTDYIYGVSYTGELSYSEGANIFSITASECAIISDTSIFLTVTKEDCSQVYECVPTNTATTAWVTERHICTIDGEADHIELLNNELISAGDQYVFVITDTMNRIRTLHFSDSLNFEGSGPDPDRVFGVSYDGNLDFVSGGPLSSITATGCLLLSDTSIFLTVYKDSCITPFDCISTTISTSDGETEISVCETDGEDDIVTLSNDKDVAPGDNYAYLITDDQNKIKFIHRTATYNFDNSGTQTFRVFGVSHDGPLQANVADSIFDITATGCIEVSDLNSFLTVNKGDCAVDTTTTTASISGVINTVKGLPLSGITVKLDNIQTTTTDNEGRYKFDELTKSTSYVITASFDEGLLNGVTAADVIASQQHILGIKRFDNPYSQIAADINNNGSVAATDIIGMLNALIGKSSEFKNNTSWKFVESGVNEAPITTLTIQLGQVNIGNADFVGVKIGDVNGNVSN